MATNNELNYLGQAGTERIVAKVKALESDKQDIQQGSENASLPLVVGEDGNVHPSALTPCGVDGAEHDGSLSIDITIEWKDGFFVNFSDGKESSFNGLSYGTTSKVEPGIVYEFTAYVDPTASPYNVICFYTADGTYIVNPDGGTYGGNAVATTPRYTFDSIDTVNNVYSVIVPPGASYARYNVYTDKITESYFKRKDEMYSLNWLVVSDKNINDAGKDAIAERTKSLLNESSLKYGHSLKKPFDFNGKSLITFGDSITSGVSSPGLVSVDSYAKRFAELNGMTYTSRASSGTFILDEEDAPYSIYKRISSWTGTADFAIVAGGVNDYSYGKPLGNYNDTADTVSFYGSLRKICECLTTNHPDTTVIFITPINCTHQPEAATIPLNHYRNAIFEIATLYGFNVVDGSQLGFPSETGGFQNAMLEDGVHPTDAGHAFYAKNLSAVLDGQNGADGYTPVRGTDYWTDADKAEIKSYVDEAILGGTW